MFPELETNRLLLNELSTDDIDSLFELFSNNSVVEYYDLEAFSYPSQANKLIELFNVRFKDNLGILYYFIILL